MRSILNLDLYSQGYVCAFCSTLQGNLCCSTFNNLCFLCRWYALRVTVQPCAVNNILRVTSCTQQSGRRGIALVQTRCGYKLQYADSDYFCLGGTDKDVICLPSHLHSQSHGNGMRSQIFLVRFIQQEVIPAGRLFLLAYSTHLASSSLCPVIPTGHPQPDGMPGFGAGS